MPIVFGRAPPHDIIPICLVSANDLGAYATEVVNDWLQSSAFILPSKLVYLLVLEPWVGYYYVVLIAELKQPFSLHTAFPCFPKISLQTSVAFPTLVFRSPNTINTSPLATLSTVSCSLEKNSAFTSLLLSSVGAYTCITVSHIYLLHSVLSSESFHWHI